MGSAMVLGVNGQDGTLIARLLLARGYSVVGLGRQSSCRVAANRHFRYRQVDLMDQGGVREALQAETPDIIFHLAAVHRSSGGAEYEPMFGAMLRVNVESLHTVLEYIRGSCPTARLVYAGSSKVFGEPYPAVVSEETPVSPVCLYSQTKVAARNLIRYYRQAHAISAAYLYLFNHESELRECSYFVPKLVRALSDAMQGNLTVARFQSLRFWCDWGSAEEYMDLAIDIAERAPNDDFVIATGISRFALDLARRMFERHGLDYRRYVCEGVAAATHQCTPYSVSTSRLEAAIGRKPVQSIDDVCEAMLDSRLGSSSVSH